MTLPAGPNLTYELRAISTLEAAEKQRMYALMTQHYNAMNRPQFEADLAWKQAVGLLREADGTIQGFSTLALNPRSCSLPGTMVLYSGDTIINQSHWGTQALVRGFCETAGRLKATWPEQRLLWFMLSKGHRTYLYLPLFFACYHPSVAMARQDQALERQADTIATTLFGQHWQRDRGVVAFPSSQGELVPELAATAWQRQTNAHVAFFLERNPRFAQGEELVCLTELSASNLRRAAQRHFVSAMSHPLTPEEQRCWLPQA